MEDTDHGRDSIRNGERATNGSLEASEALRALRAGLAILAIGLLTTPSVAGLIRHMLGSRAGWTFELPWQRPVVTIAAVWFQNGIWLLGTLLYRRQLRETVGIRRERRAGLSDVAAGVGWGFFLLVINAWTARLTLWFWQGLLPADRFAARVERERGVLLSFFGEQQPTWLIVALVLTVAVVAPLGEELLFRGLLHRALRTHWRRWAYVGSAGLFAAIHLYVIHFVPVFALGVLLAWLYERRENVVAPVVAHGVVNGLVAVAHLALRATQAG